jgi:internalin A
MKSVLILIISGLLLSISVNAVVVEIKDPLVEEIIRKSLRKKTGPISEKDLLKITSLSLSKSKITDISVLAKCGNLQRLDLSYFEIKDLNPLSGLIKLDYVKIYKNKVHDISGLSKIKSLKNLTIYSSENFLAPHSQFTGLTNLYSLSLNIGKINDLSIFSKITDLDSLTIEKANISDLSKLSKQSQLKNLSLPNNDITDISPLNDLKNLQYLVLSGNKIGSIPPLPLIQLKIIKLDKNEITDISGLSKAINLKSIHLNNNKLKNIPSLPLTKLRNLYLNDNNISDLGGLSSANNLRGISLKNNQIKILSNLNKIKNLSAIDLSYNELSKLPDLSNMQLIYGLNLSNNNISDISNLSHLKLLTRLGLDKNKIEDISGLQGLEYLSSINLSNNQIKQLDALKGKQFLQGLKCENNLITSIEPLIGMRMLQSHQLKLRGNKISSNDYKKLKESLKKSIYNLPATHKIFGPDPGHRAYNLRQFHNELNMYMGDNRGYYPLKPGIDGLEILFTTYYSKFGKHYKNSSNKNSTAGNIKKPITEASTDYAYVAAGFQDSFPDYNIPFIFEKPYKGMNGKLHVLFNNGIALVDVGDAKTCADVIKALGYKDDHLLMINAKKIDNGDTKGSGKIHIPPPPLTFE